MLKNELVPKLLFLLPVQERCSYLLAPSPQVCLQITEYAQQGVVPLSTVSISAAVGLEGKGFVYYEACRAWLLGNPVWRQQTVCMHHEGIQGGGPGKQGEAILFSESAEAGKEKALPTAQVKRRCTHQIKLCILMSQCQVPKLTGNYTIVWKTV